MTSKRQRRKLQRKKSHVPNRKQKGNATTVKKERVERKLAKLKRGAKN